MANLRGIYQSIRIVNRIICTAFERREKVTYYKFLKASYSNLYPYSQVTNNEQDTAEVIKELKRMPLLKKFSISVRADCDEILRQISLTNKKLEELHVSNCTGFTFSLSHRQLFFFFLLIKFFLVSRPYADRY